MAHVQRGGSGDFPCGLTQRMGDRPTNVSPERTSGAHPRALDKAITPVRMSTYLARAGRDPAFARRLYVWDRDIAVAPLAEMAILEVALNTP